MRAFSVIEGRPDSWVVLCCEHASNELPPEYAGLGVSREELADHISWDIGAADVTKFVAEALGAPAVLSGASRLLIDCNRGRSAPSLIVRASDGVAVPGNSDIDDQERERRITRFYQPYHDALDEVLRRHANALLLSVHSFTPMLRIAGEAARSFDAGVLFDEHPVIAERFGRGLEQAGLSVRYNEPYSGLSGLIFSARHHGINHERRYLELELNNGRLRTAASIESVAGLVATAIESLLEEE
jgi:predicted N-formylglutamate amidohydrolase